MYCSAEDAPADKISESEKKTLLDKCSDILKWLDNNLLAEKDEYEFKLKEFQKEAQPYMVIFSDFVTNRALY